MEGQYYDIWIEGYHAQGNIHAKHRLVAWRQPGNNFLHAVSKYVKRCEESGEGEPQYWRCSPAGEWTYWGCRVFDNAVDAAKSFG